MMGTREQELRASVDLIISLAFDAATHDIKDDVLYGHLLVKHAPEMLELLEQIKRHADANLDDDELGRAVSSHWYAMEEVINKVKGEAE